VAGGDIKGDRARSVRIESGALASEYGCTLRYEYYEPVSDGNPDGGPGANPRPPGAPAPLVVLGHGFMRDLSSMRGWAREWATRGTRTIVISFCNSSWFDGAHERNARDMIATARHIEPGDAPILYAGFSAGGLSALLAASQDERAVGYLGLDPVDSGGLAASVERLRMPALFLYGEPASCNAENNMIPAMPETARRLALRIPYASHCDFENPYDEVCAGFCGAVEPEESGREIRRTIHALATAWVEAQLGAAPASRRAFDRHVLETAAERRRVEVVMIE
jgi:pimeloyl-ACP methyl ester carboxylesterase